MQKSDARANRCDPEELRSRPCWQLLLLGFFGGAGGTLIGVGGGIVMVPFLTLWGMSQRLAQGTSLFVIFVISPIAVLTYWYFENIDFAFGIPLAVGGLIGGRIGAVLAHKISNKVLAKAFGVFLILVAIKMLISDPSNNDGNSVSGALFYFKAGLFGILAGMVAGFFGVGGGVVFVPTGTLLGHLSQEIAQGSSFLAIIPTSGVASATYAKNREVSWNTVKWLLPGAVVGAVVGSTGAEITGANTLKIIFALYLIYTGITKLINNK